jgi:enoyl-CoA hydratase/carnithine racemase
MSKRPPPPPALPDNGIIQVHYDGKVIDYDLVSIHYRLDEQTGVAICTLNEPERLNALTTNQIWEYMLLLQHFEHDDNVKVVVWTGHGRAFSSGADLSAKAPLCQLPEEAMEWFRTKSDPIFEPGYPTDMGLKGLTLRFWDFSKISIVAVNGLAVGGAANLALANFHDIVLASPEARFKYPFSDLGLTPELGSSYMMPMITGMAKAKNMMLLGDWFDAEQAKDMGLVLEVLEKENLVPRAIELATTLAAKQQIPLRLNKKLMNSHFRREMERVMDLENKTINLAVESMMPLAGQKSKL